MPTNNEERAAEQRPAGYGAVVRREVHRIFYRRRYAMLMLVLPLVSFFVSWTIFLEQSPRNMPVAVVDLDHSPLSRALLKAIDATASMRVARQPVDTAAGREIIRSGQAYAMVVIPHHLERDIKKGMGGQVIGYYNAQMLLAGSIISSSLQAAVDSVSAALSYETRLRGGSSRAVALARIEPVHIDRHTLFNPQLNYVYFLVLALWPTFLQIFVMMTAVVALGEEFKESTAGGWFATAGGNVWWAAAGKLTPYWVYFSALGVLMLWVLLNGLGVTVPGSAVYLLLATLLLVLAYLACGLIVVAFNPSFRMALSITSFFSGVAFAFVGLTFPQSGMPPLARAWSNLLPLTHYLHILMEQAVRGATVRDSFPEMIILCGYVALAVGLLPMLRKHIRNSAYWGLF